MLKALLAVTITVLVTQAAVLATSIYLHRGLAHRALTLHPIADFFFRIILWLPEYAAAKTKSDRNVAITEG